MRKTGAIGRLMRSEPLFGRILSAGGFQFFGLFLDLFDNMLNHTVI